MGRCTRRTCNLHRILWNMGDLLCIEKFRAIRSMMGCSKTQKEKFAMQKIEQINVMIQTLNANSMRLEKN